MTATTATVVDCRANTARPPRTLTQPEVGAQPITSTRQTWMSEALKDARHRAAASSTRRASTRTFQTEVTSPDPTEARAMIDLDQFRAELAGSLAGLSPSQRLKAGREMAERLGVVLAAIERGEIDASATETARLQGAAVALATLAG